VADVVKLDHNNRILVAQGSSACAPTACSRASGPCLPPPAATPPGHHFDMGFALGPRLNAAGRLADMSLGIECLITDDMGRALNIAQELDKLNRERRAIEADMQEDAMAGLDAIDPGAAQPDAVRSRMAPGRDRHPGRAHQGEIPPPHHRLRPGQRRRAQGLGPLHPRPAPARRARPRHQAGAGLILKFGGHAMAAGLTIREAIWPASRRSSRTWCRA
jgi:single-stranded-DNA-specific exonuclease